MPSRRLLLAAAPFAGIHPAGAQGDWRPSRPIRLLVGFPPGGPLDLLARLIATSIGDGLGQRLIVENRPGATGSIATQALLSADPDGHTIMMTTADTQSILPAVNPRLPYNAADVVPVSGVATDVFCLIARPGLPIGTLPELVAYARASRVPLSYASFGYGSSSHFGAEVLRAATGTDLTHVPFQGSRLAIIAIIADQVDFMVVPVAAANPQRSSVRLLGVASAQRLALLPDVPTLAEQGVPVVVETWLGIVAPSRTPSGVTAALHAAVSGVQQRPDFQDWLRGNGFTSLDLNPAAFTTFLQAEAERWGNKVRVANIRIPS